MNDQEIKKALKNWKQIIKEYKKPSSKSAVIQILNSFIPFFAIWILMYFSLEISYWITLGLAVLNSFFLSRIFIIQHDCGHYSFFKSKKWNDRIGLFCSFFSTLPFKYWARVHSFHHGHTGQYEFRDIGDIDFLTTYEYRKLGKWGRFKYRLFRNPFILFGIVPIVYFTMSNRFPIVQFKGWRKISISQILNNIGMVLVYILLAFVLGWKQFLLVHIPIVFMFSVIAFWFFYVQHQHEHCYKQLQKNWDFLISSIKGSSHYDLPRVWHWLTGNIGFHHIHHLSSHIPNYNLIRCAKENPILQKYTTSIGFVESIKCMQHKLWDEDAQRMISFKEFYRREKTGLNTLGN